MKKMSIALMIFCFAAFLLFLLPAGAQGNNPNEVYVQYIETSPSGNGLGLDVYFTIRDSDGQIVPDANIASAEITVIDIGNYAARVSQPTTDFYVTFVLDVSGSMGENNAIFNMRDAAVAAINSAPAGAHFSVIAFDHEITPQVDTADGFTDQPNIAINRVVALQERDGGTCLYDAAHYAVQQISTVPSPRRAIVLFTDGRDELIRGGPLDTCSTHTVAEVIQTAEDAGVAIHTIGMRGTDPINEDELARMAYQTHGFPVIGTQANLNGLFQQIMTGLSSQYLASTTVYVSRGSHDGVLRVTLNNGLDLQPGIFQFTSSGNYALTPTPPAVPPTATPLPPTIEVVGIQTDTDDRQVSFELEVENGEHISEYLFRFTNEDTGLQQQEEVRSVPLGGRITFNTRDWPTGCYTVRVTAFASNGNRLITAESSRFCYTLPTPTPTRTLTPTRTPTYTPTPSRTPTPTQTNTPVPVGATLNSVQFDEGAGIFRLRFTLRSQNRISALRVEFYNATTGQLIGSPYRMSVQEVVEITATDFPEGQYRVVVTSLDDAGEALVSDSGQAVVTELVFTHILPTPIPSATFTSTPTETPTATPVIVSVTINPPRQEGGSMIFPLRTENEDLVGSYEVIFINESGISSAPVPYVAPLSELRVPLNLVEGGRYIVEIRALDDQGNQLAEARLPGTIIIPTPVPPTPTPAPASFPSIEWMGENAGIVAPLIIVLIAGLLLVLVLLIRQPEKRSTGTGFLDELTRAQEAKDIPPVYTPPAAGDDADKTNYELQLDPDATNFELQLPLPIATLRIEKSGDKSVIGKLVAIEHVPFNIGRKASNSLSIPGDSNVSAEHAVITFAEDTFYIADIGSRHGTVVDDQRLAPRTQTALTTGARIRIAETTIFVFEIQPDDIDLDSHDTGA